MTQHLNWINSKNDLLEFAGHLFVNPLDVQNEEYLEWHGTDLESYYKNSLTIAQDLAKWHDESFRLKAWYSIYLNSAHGKVLDYGAGIGSLCIYLAQTGLDVHYFDVCKQCIDFAKWRFKKHNVKVKVIDRLDNDYHTIFMIDVIGHLSKPDEVLADLVKRLCLGGTFILTNDAVESIEHRQHRALTFDLTELMADLGMRQVCRGHILMYVKEK